MEYRVANETLGDQFPDKRRPLGDLIFKRKGTIASFIHILDSQIEKTNKYPIIKTYLKERQEKMMFNKIRLCQSTFDTLETSLFKQYSIILIKKGDFLQNRRPKMVKGLPRRPNWQLCWQIEVEVEMMLN